jgi:hypothetical protein
MTNLAPYPEWGGPRLADPRQATLDQLESGLTNIVASEGPILKDANMYFDVMSAFAKRP